MNGVRGDGGIRRACSRIEIGRHIWRRPEMPAAGRSEDHWGL